MNRHLSLALVAILAVLCFEWASTTVVYAEKPFVEEFQFVDDAVPVGNCGDFLIIADGVGNVRQTVYFDQDGTPVRLLFQGRYRGTLTNSVTGFQLSDEPSVANIFVDLLTNTQTNVGVFYNITLPGEGAVLFEVGRIVFGGAPGVPTFIAGPHLPPGQQFAIICNALDRPL